MVGCVDQRFAEHCDEIVVVVVVGRGKPPSPVVVGDEGVLDGFSDERPVWVVSVVVFTGCHVTSEFLLT